MGLCDAALIVVDVQQGFDDVDYWGGARNNSCCEQNVAQLIQAFRSRDQRIVFVRHNSSRKGAPLHPESPGNRFKSVLAGEPNLLVTKSVNSAFYGTPDLDRWLRAQGIQSVAICGITTNHCCETTARMAGNLGYETYFILDATHTFDRAAPDGGVITADELARTTAVNLDGEFATVIDTERALADLSRRSVVLK